MKKRQWEPETIKGYGASDYSGLWLTFLMEPDLVHDTPVRLIREKDWQKVKKLLRLARKAQTAKRTP